MVGQRREPSFRTRRTSAKPSTSRTSNFASPVTDALLPTFEMKKVSWHAPSMQLGASAFRRWMLSSAARIVGNHSEPMAAYLSRASRSLTCTECQFSFPVGVRTPRSFNALAMSPTDVTPAAQSPAIIGATSAARRRGAGFAVRTHVWLAFEVLETGNPYDSSISMVTTCPQSTH